ncbi:MAG: diphthine synthase [Candidatus Micrarchaeia archaeon]
MLILAGLGLYLDDLSLAAFNELGKADVLLIEQYTSFLPKGYKEELEKRLGKQIKEVGRADLEQNLEKTIEPAKSSTLAILIPGDPLIVTTHKSIIDIAEKEGIEVRVYHASSVLTVAIGESRLSLYKFGQVANIPFWQKDYEPTAFINTVKANLERGLHSLLFLDIDHEHKRPMSLEECFEVIRKSDSREKAGILAEDPLVLVMGDLGAPSQKIALTKLSSMAKLGKDFEGKAISIIILAGLSFSEEAVRKFQAQ